MQIQHCHHGSLAEGHAQIVPVLLEAGASKDLDSIVARYEGNLPEVCSMGILLFSWRVLRPLQVPPLPRLGRDEHEEKRDAPGAVATTAEAGAGDVGVSAACVTLEQIP